MRAVRRAARVQYNFHPPQSSNLQRKQAPTDGSEPNLVKELSISKRDSIRRWHRAVFANLLRSLLRELRVRNLRGRFLVVPLFLQLSLFLNLLLVWLLVSVLLGTGFYVPRAII